MDRWQDRVAVVTGASEGIGDATVRRLAASGMKVAALARRHQLLEELERSVNVSGTKGSVKGYICDVTSNDDVIATFRSIEKDMGPISVLVNNAGVYAPVILTDINLENAKKLLDTNVIGVMNCTKVGIDSMKLHNVNDGHVINISSVAAHNIPERPEVAFYGATKHALKVLTASLKSQLKKENSKIRVSCVSPGFVKTGMTKQAIEKSIIKDFMLPEDIADAVAYVIAAPKHVNVSEMIINPV